VLASTSASLVMTPRDLAANSTEAAAAGWAACAVSCVRWSAWRKNPHLRLLNHLRVSKRAGYLFCPQEEDDDVEAGIQLVVHHVNLVEEAPGLLLNLHADGLGHEFTEKGLLALVGQPAHDQATVGVRLGGRSRRPRPGNQVSVGWDLKSLPASAEVLSRWRLWAARRLPLQRRVGWDLKSLPASVEVLSRWRLWAARLRLQLSVFPGCARYRARPASDRDGL
jgi:hypothetical protein